MDRLVLDKAWALRQLTIIAESSERLNEAAKEAVRRPSENNLAQLDCCLILLQNEMAILNRAEDEVLENLL